MVQRNHQSLAKRKASPRLSHREHEALCSLLPAPPPNHPDYEFDFIDLFAGIGGIRRGFEHAGGRCVFTSEWNDYAIRTYKANHYGSPVAHSFNDDIRKVTLSEQENVSEKVVAANIHRLIPDHDVLLAGFPCQHSRSPEYQRKMPLAERTDSNVKPKARYSLMWRGLLR